MYDSSAGITSAVFLLFIAALSLVVLYFIIKAAVTEGMKQHTRWHVANRDEIERKYGKKPGDSPPAT